LFTGNKLCNVASRLRRKGFNIICPNHYGLCTANLAEDAVIGNETVYSKKCAVEVSDYLKISRITTDGDSKAFLALISRAKRFFLFSLLMPENRDVQNCSFQASCQVSHIP
jgi:hypothetical protein